MTSVGQFVFTGFYWIFTGYVVFNIECNFHILTKDFLCFAFKSKKQNKKKEFTLCIKVVLFFYENEGITVTSFFLSCIELYKKYFWTWLCKSWRKIADLFKYISWRKTKGKINKIGYILWFHWLNWNWIEICLWH